MVTQASVSIENESSFNLGAAKVLMWGTATLFLLGAGLAGFGVLNKLFAITPASTPLPNVVIHGLALILLAGMCALFGGESLQLANLHRSITHSQSQLEQLKQTSTVNTRHTRGRPKTGCREPKRCLTPCVKCRTVPPQPGIRELLGCRAACPAFSRKAASVSRKLSTSACLGIQPVS